MQRFVAGRLKLPARGSAEQSGAGETRDSRPLRDVEAGDGVDLFFVGACVVRRDGRNDAGQPSLALGLRGALPEDIEGLPAYGAADRIFSVR